MIIPEDDKVLLKIYRQFSKEESVAELLRRISELSIKLGEQKSEIYELRYQQYKQANVKEERVKKVVERIIVPKELSKDEMLKNINDYWKEKFEKLNNRYNIVRREKQQLSHQLAAAIMKLNKIESEQ